MTNALLVMHGWWRLALAFRLSCLLSHTGPECISTTIFFYIYCRSGMYVTSWMKYSAWDIKPLRPDCGCMPRRPPWDAAQTHASVLGTRSPGQTAAGPRESHTPRQLGGGGGWGWGREQQSILLSVQTQKRSIAICINQAQSVTYILKLKHLISLRHINLPRIQTTPH